MTIPAPLVLKSPPAPLKGVALPDGRKMYKISYKKGQRATWSLFFHSDDDVSASTAARAWCKSREYRFIDVEPAVISLIDAG